MWIYSYYFIYGYLLLFDCVPLAQVQPTIPPRVDPRVIWNELKEVTDYTIDESIRDKSPHSLFQPTSFLNPGYGVLYEHIRQLHQSVYKHYLIIGI